MSEKIDVPALLASVDIIEVASRYLTLKKEGNEFVSCCCFHSEKTPSLKFSRQKQIWACFGCGAHENGASVLDFVMRYEGIGFLEACERLKNGNGSAGKPVMIPPLKKAPPWRSFAPPTDELPDLEHNQLGAPLKVWIVRDADGRPLVIEARYGALTGPGKETRFWSWGNYSDQDPARWECKAPSRPRPLYGLDELARRPTAQVMIHEAPKKAEAAQALFPKLVHLGIVGGVYQAPHMDLTPLAGRRCILLPDNDRPGKEAMMTLAKLLREAGAERVEAVNPSTQPDGNASPDGWDIADVENWTPDMALAWAKPRKVPPHELLMAPSEPPQEAPEQPSVDKAPSAPKPSDAPAQVKPAPATVAAPPIPAETPKTWDGLALILGNKGEVKACEHNAKELMAAAKQYDCLHFDSFLYRVRIGTRDWSDADDRDAVCWLQSAHQVAGFTLNQTRTAAMALAHARPHDSLFEFVMGLPEWDGTPRIEQAFTSAWGAPDDILTRAASRNFFIALHARAVKPGAQVDNLWAIEGPQGRLKSASLRALGEHFHAEISSPVGTNDFLRELQGVWIAELSELDSLRGREASTVKRLLSAPSDRFVQKYEKHASAYPRRAVAVATTNEATYWQDSTGARRLIPVRVGEIRLDIIQAERLQWFAEARHLHQAGARWWEFPDGVAQAQESRQAVDPWEDTLRGYIDNGRMDADGYAKPWPEGWIASAEIMSDWLKLNSAQLGKASSTRLGHVMRQLGFEPKRSPNGMERGWTPRA